jgi:hypothetical protein
LTLTDGPPEEVPESRVEQRFRHVFLHQMHRLGATVTEVPGPAGNTAHITLPGAPRQWTLSPQVLLLERSQPDFVLESSDASLTIVAIFVDGYAFHVSTVHNRLARDAKERAILRDRGWVVLSVTLEDLLDAEAGVVSSPDWFDESLADALFDDPLFRAPRAAFAALGWGPIDWLVDWVQSPAPEHVRNVACSVSTFLAFRSETLNVTATESLDQVARNILVGEQVTPGARDIRVYQRGALVAVSTAEPGYVRLAVVLDDRPQAFDDRHVDAWRRWLRLSNSLALCTYPTTITTVKLAA